MDFRTLEECPGYEIYDNGMIIRDAKIGINGNKLKRKVIHPTLTKNGYYTVRLSDHMGRMRQFYLHRLVYMVFRGDITGKEIDHIDTNRANCALSNLRAVTHRQNCSNEVSRERYRIANSLDKGKYDYERLQLARTQEYHNKLIATYQALRQEHGKVGVMMLMKEGHTNYYRAKRIIKEMEGENVQTADIQNISGI